MSRARLDLALAPTLSPGLQQMLCDWALPDQRWGMLVALGERADLDGDVRARLLTSRLPGAIAGLAAGGHLDAAEVAVLVAEGDTRVLEALAGALAPGHPALVLLASGPPEAQVALARRTAPFGEEVRRALANSGRPEVDRALAAGGTLAHRDDELVWQVLARLASRAPGLGERSVENLINALPLTSQREVAMRAVALGTVWGVASAAALIGRGDATALAAMEAALVGGMDWADEKVFEMHGIDLELVIRKVRPEVARHLRGELDAAWRQGHGHLWAARAGVEYALMDQPDGLRALAAGARDEGDLEAVWEALRAADLEAYDDDEMVDAVRGAIAGNTALDPQLRASHASRMSEEALEAVAPALGDALCVQLVGGVGPSSAGEVADVHLLAALAGCRDPEAAAEAALGRLGEVGARHLHDLAEGLVRFAPRAVAARPELVAVLRDPSRGGLLAALLGEEVDQAERMLDALDAGYSGPLTALPGVVAAMGRG